MLELLTCLRVAMCDVGVTKAQPAKEDFVMMMKFIQHIILRRVRRSARPSSGPRPPPENIRAAQRHRLVLTLLRSSDGACSGYRKCCRLRDASSRIERTGNLDELLGTRASYGAIQSVVSAASLTARASVMTCSMIYHVRYWSCTGDLNKNPNRGLLIVELIAIALHQDSLATHSFELMDHGSGACFL